MKAEACEWAKPKGKWGATPSESMDAVRGMRIGEVLRITHDDLHCGYGKGRSACGLMMILSRLRKEGRRYEAYHEGPHVAVVRRLE